MLINNFGKFIEPEDLSEKKIVFYGASTRNQRVIEAYNLKNNIVCYIDSDTSKSGMEMNGYRIYSTKSIEDYKDCVFLSVLHNCITEIMDSLLVYGIDECMFYRLDEFDIFKWYDSNMRILGKRRKYKYLHIFHNNKFTEPFYQMLEECFELDEHLFIVAYMLPGDYCHLLPFIEKKNTLHQNILMLDDFDGDFIEKIKIFQPQLDCNSLFFSDGMMKIYSCAEKIFLHSTFNGKTLLEYMKFLTRDYAEKMAWLCWGADANYEPDDEIVQEVIRKIKYSYVFEACIAHIERQYNITPIVTKLTYSYLPKNICREINNQKSNKIRILLGHSAYPYVNHVDGFEVLSNFKSDNIEVIAPLSYGYENYRQEVIKKGKEIFGSKYIPLLDYMELSEYYDFLKSIDIAIMPLIETSAGTTLKYLNSMGTPIFMFEYMRQIFSFENINSRNIEDIREYSYEELCEISRNSKEYDSSLIEKNNSEVVSEWRKVFDE